MRLEDKGQFTHAVPVRGTHDLIFSFIYFAH